ncbi:MAG: amidase [bacterium]|nr:amidase [bacterium]MDE0290658.1 amidase [bacterium]MDE0439111.1 amidase [bacterium]
MIARQISRLDRGEVTARQLAVACLAEIADRDAHLRCFLEVDRAGALDQAQASDRRRRDGRTLGPLDGIPVAVKANLAVEGFAWSGGIDARSEITAARDAPAVDALRASGAVILGTTNLPDAALGAVTANPWFGVCRNPRLPGRHAGGSSGGSAAAVAAGMALVALGSDTMGSVRIPAAWCGVAGWKPSEGLVPTVGLLPLSARLDTVGLLASTAEELMVTAKAAGFLSPSPPDRQPPHLLVPVDLVERTEPGIQDVFWGAVAELGWKPEKIRLGLDPTRVRLAGLLALEAEAYLFYREALHANPQGFSPEARSLLEYAEAAPAWKLARSYRILDGVRRRMAELLTTAQHILALPTTPYPPVRIGDPVPPELADLTAFVNAVGGCAISIPVLTVAGGPVGLQLVGRPRGDWFLLRTAREATERLAS